MADTLSAERRRWQMQEDLSTLQRAAEIQGDKKRLTAVQKHATEQLRQLEKVAKVTKPKSAPAKKGK